MVEAPRSAGALLREARRRAGLSQAELARRAGVAQSVISAYESGHRQPALSTLSALISAAGCKLDVQVSSPEGKPAPLSGPLGQRVRQRRSRLIRAAGARGVSNLCVFGSVARGDEHPGSDVDLVADLPGDMGLLGLARLEAELGEILGAPVDLAPADSLKPGIKSSADTDLVPL
jgi:uncharacterized protein